MPKVASKKTGQNVTYSSYSSHSLPSSSLQAPQEPLGPTPPQESEAVHSVQDSLRAPGVQGGKRRKSGPTPSFELPLTQYVIASLQYAIDNEVNREEEWQNGIFDFARLLKSHPIFQKYAVVDLVKEITKHLGEDWSFELGRGDEQLELIDAQTEFIAVWPKIRINQDVEPIAMAAELAKVTTLKLDPTLGDRMDIYHKFISVCGWLCVTLNRTDIAIPCEAFAAELRVATMTISRLRKQAIQDGYMTIRTKHNHGNHLAATFWFKDYLFEPIKKQMALNKKQENTSGE